MSNLSDYTTFNFPANSAQTIAVSAYADGLYSFTDTHPYLTGNTNITFTGIIEKLAFSL